MRGSVTDTLRCQQWLLQPVSLICYRQVSVTDEGILVEGVTVVSVSFNQYQGICWQTPWCNSVLQPVSPHLLQTPYTNSGSFNQYPLICYRHLTPTVCPSTSIRGSGYRHLTPTVTPSTSIPSSVTDTLHQQWVLQPVSPHLLQTPYTNSGPSTSIPSSVTDTLHQQWLLQPVSPHLLQTPWFNSDSFNQYPLICYRHLGVTVSFNQYPLICYRHLTPTVSFNQYPLICYRHLTPTVSFNQYPLICYRHLTPTVSFNQYPLICYRHLTPTVSFNSIPSSVTDTLV